MSLPGWPEEPDFWSPGDPPPSGHATSRAAPGRGGTEDGLDSTAAHDDVRRRAAPPRDNPRRLRILAMVIIALVVLAAAAVLLRAPWRSAETTAAPDPARVAVGPSPDAPGVRSPEDAVAPAPTIRALVQLAALQVRGRAPLTGYDREQFGQAWADVDRNGCDTRNDILRRDLDEVEIRPGTNGCLVLTGSLVDPYSGTTIDFVRGQDTSALVQVDHVVALADAWQSGAQRWDLERRTAFANDPLNLLAVDGGLNQQKRASNAASWLPPDRGSWCGYASQQIAVKHAYGLSVTSAERDALERAARRCPSDVLLAPPGPVPLGRR